MKRDYIDFQDRSNAKAYLITFRTFGTWFHGDERGSMDRRNFNRVDSPRIKPDADRVAREKKMAKGPTYLLDVLRRKLVETAIREVCGHRGYALIAVNVRTNHVHLVVSNGGTPERMMDSFKAYATRALRSASQLDATAKAWSRHGSTRYLWTDGHIDAAVEYVAHGQGGELPRFE